MEFPWSHDDLPNAPAVHGPPVFITEEMVCKVLATGPSGVALEMILALQQHIVAHLEKLANNIVAEGKFPEDWNLSHIINCFKGKGGPLVMGSYHGLKLLDHIMKIVEHVIKSIIRSSLNVNKMQYGFMPGHGIMDAIFIL